MLSFHSTAFLLARRYFLQPGKKKNVVQVVSLISMVGVGIGSMSLIVALSVFNGLEQTVRNLYARVDPEIIITPSHGKFFDYTPELRDHLGKLAGVTLTEVIEDNALVSYKGAQRVVKIRGVSPAFLDTGRLDREILSPAIAEPPPSFNYAIVGAGLKLALNIVAGPSIPPLQIFYPGEYTPGSLRISSPFRARRILPLYIFRVEKYYDENYILVPLDFATGLFGHPNERTAIEVDRSDSAMSIEELQSIISESLGPDFLVRKGWELHAELFRILKIEKLFVLLVFVLIIGISSINIYFSLLMLVMEKQKDISLLSSMGATTGLVRSVFLCTGGMITMTGGGVGTLAGLGLVLLQKHFGLVSMRVGSSLVDSYPVRVLLSDFVVVMAAIVVFTFLASILPASAATGKMIPPPDRR